MEKKPTSTLANISKSQLKNLNKVYQVEPIRDENRIDEIISIFIGGNLSSIKSILESNQIINFKDSIGQTLIHAILRNESDDIDENDIKLDKKFSIYF